MPGLARALDLAPLALADPTSFNEDADLISPWTIAVAVAQRAAARESEKILSCVEQEEVDAAMHATYGHWLSRRRREEDWIPPEVCQRVDEEHGRPIRAILRDWCGADSVDLRAEMAVLRKGASSAGRVAYEAIELLRRLGHKREADELERKLLESGQEVDPLR